MKITKNKLELMVEETISSILEAAGAHSITNPGAHSIARPGAKSIASAPKSEDTLSSAVGGLEGSLQQAQQQIQQLGTFQQQVVGLAGQDPENPLAQAIMSMLNEEKSLNESIIELDIPDASETLPQQGVQHHHGKHGEGSMAKAQMMRMCDDAVWLLENVDDVQELESWVQAKITKASDYIQSVRNYLEYHKLDKLNEENKKVSKAGQKRVSKKIGYLIGKEGKPEDQAAAIAYSMEKRGELKEQDNDLSFAVQPDDDLRWMGSDFTGVKGYAVIDPDLIEDNEYLPSLKTTAGEYRKKVADFDDASLERALVGQGATATHQYGSQGKPFERYSSDTAPDLQGRQKLPRTWSLMYQELEKRRKAFQERPNQKMAAQATTPTSEPTS
jgi:hypothetical protein